jgi:response regulator NasT
MVSEIDPTLVIMDVKMPEMDGIDAAKNISAKKTIPIILITGLSSDEMATKAIESGFSPTSSSLSPKRMP